MNIGIITSVVVASVIILIASSCCFTILHTNIMTDIGEKIDAAPNDILIHKSEISKYHPGRDVVINP